MLGVHRLTTLADLHTSTLAGLSWSCREDFVGRAELSFCFHLYTRCEAPALCHDSHDIQGVIGTSMQAESLLLVWHLCLADPCKYQATGGDDLCSVVM